MRGPQAPRASSVPGAATCPWSATPDATETQEVPDHQGLAELLEEVVVSRLVVHQAGDERSLDKVEHDIINPVFQEPRIHFAALTCRTRSVASRWYTRAFVSTKTGASPGLRPKGGNGVNRSGLEEAGEEEASAVHTQAA